MLGIDTKKHHFRDVTKMMFRAVKALCLLSVMPLRMILLYGSLMIVFSLSLRCLADAEYYIVTCACTC